MFNMYSVFLCLCADTRGSWRCLYRNRRRGSRSSLVGCWVGALNTPTPRSSHMERGGRVRVTEGEGREGTYHWGRGKGGYVSLEEREGRVRVTEGRGKGGYVSLREREGRVRITEGEGREGTYHWGRGKGGYVSLREREGRVRITEGEGREGTYHWGRGKGGYVSLREREGRVRITEGEGREGTYHTFWVLS